MSSFPNSLLPPQDARPSPRRGRFSNSLLPPEEEQPIVPPRPRRLESPPGFEEEHPGLARFLDVAAPFAEFAQTPISQQLGGETFGSLVERIFPEGPAAGGWRGTTGDIARLAAGLADFIQTPAGVAALAATAATGGAAAPAMFLPFAAQAAVETPEAVRRYLEDPTPQNLQQALLTPAFAALLASASAPRVAEPPFGALLEAPARQPTVEIIPPSRRLPAYREPIITQPPPGSIPFAPETAFVRGVPAEYGVRVPQTRPERLLPAAPEPGLPFGMSLEEAGQAQGLAPLPSIRQAPARAKPITPREAAAVEQRYREGITESTREAEAEPGSILRESLGEQGLEQLRQNLRGQVKEAVKEEVRQAVEQETGVPRPAAQAERIPIDEAIAEQRRALEAETDPVGRALAQRSLKDLEEAKRGGITTAPSPAAIDARVEASKTASRERRLRRQAVAEETGIAPRGAEPFAEQAATGAAGEGLPFLLRQEAARRPVAPEPALPGLERAIEEQRAGVARVGGERLAGEFARPLEERPGQGIEAAPIFRGTEAAPQRELLTEAPKVPFTQTKPPRDLRPRVKVRSQYAGRDRTTEVIFPDKQTAQLYELGRRIGTRAKVDVDKLADETGLQPGRAAEAIYQAQAYAREIVRRVQDNPGSGQPGFGRPMEAPTIAEAMKGENAAIERRIAREEGFYLSPKERERRVRTGLGRGLVDMHRLRSGTPDREELGLPPVKGGGGLYSNPFFSEAFWEQAGAELRRIIGGEPKAEAGAGRKPTPIEAGFNSRASETAGVVNQAADALTELSEGARIGLSEAENISRAGTLSPEARAQFRKALRVPRSETRQFRLSEGEARAGMGEVVKAAREVRRLLGELERGADPLSMNTAQAADAAVQAAVKRLEASVRLAERQRLAAGRTVESYNVPLPEDVTQTLRDAGLLIGRLKNIRERVPIASNILRSLRNWRNLSELERRQFARDLVDHFRLNLFAVTSWTLDLVGNLSEIGAQVAGGAAADVVYVARTGEPTFPSLQGFFRAIRERAVRRGQPMGPELEEAFGRTVSGERIPGKAGRGPGTFTFRQGIGSTIYDYVVGGPLYAKGAVDLAAKRLMATTTIWRESIKAADARGLTGTARRRFIEDFQRALPEQVSAAATESGNKAGFNRPLSRLEERIARSTAARLLVDVFARWPFQFTRWGAEVLGYNRPLFEKIGKGQATPEEIAAYLGKAATGWGALYLINQTLYNQTDFATMEYVDEDGNRVRLSNRDPLPTALWFLAVIKGDKERAAAGLRYASVPGARLLAGEGGLLGGTLRTFTQAAQNPQNDPRALRRELDNSINRAIPGQAVLGALKTVFDPTIREGVGAGLPGVSQALPAAIDPTTGEPLRPRQRLLGVEVPAIGGTPIPGATRILPDVQKVLLRYGLPVFRGPSGQVAGYPAGQAPREILREWQVVFGKSRQELLGTAAKNAARLEQEFGYEEVRAAIQELDAEARRIATEVLNRKYGTTGRLPRQPTRRERTGPAKSRGVTPAPPFAMLSPGGFVPAGAPFGG